MAIPIIAIAKATTTSKPVVVHIVTASVLQPVVLALNRFDMAVGNKAESLLLGFS